MATYSITPSYAHPSGQIIAGSKRLKTYIPARSATSSFNIPELVKRAFAAVTDDHNSEKFYQDHVITIYMGLYLEMCTALGLAMIGIKLFTN